MGCRGKSMKWKIAWLCRHIIKKSRQAIISEYGKDFYDSLYRGSQEKMQDLLPQIPDINKSVFGTNYYFCACYFPWFATLKSMGQSDEEAVRTIWFINEAYLQSWPAWLMKLGGKYYSNRHQKVGPWAAKFSEQGKIHPDDWKIQYEMIDNHTWKFDVLECFVVKLAKRLEMEAMLPGVCRMDYLFSHYFDVEFRRKGTLADGFECCDCWYQYPGKSDWPVPMDIEGNR